MITNFNIYILEKSSLTELGINSFIMKNVQKDFALSADAKWETTNKKIDLINELNEDKNVIIIQLSTNSTKILVKYKYNEKFIYFIDEYLEIPSDWDSDWKKLKRVFLNKTELISKIQSHSLYYILKSGEFTNILKSDRDIIKDEINYNEFYENFKSNIILNFNNIVKRIWNKQAEDIKKEIISNLDNDNLHKNIDLTKKLEYYHKLQKLEDPYSLNSKIQHDNSLTIIDKKILEFEEQYTQYFKEYLNIKELCDYFTKDKVITIFFYFLYSGKIYNK